MYNRETRRRRILMLAFNCNPNFGSEEAEGWNRAMECAKHFDTWVITHGNDNARQIREFLHANGEIPGLHFEFVDLLAGEERLLITPWFQWLIFKRWHRGALRAARRLHAALDFDLVHQVTGIAYREPGYLWKLGIPFVWGPIGGTENFPWRFLFEGGFRGAASEAARNVVNIAQMRLSRRVSQTAHRAKALLFANSTGRNQFRRALGVSGQLMLDAGIKGVAQSQPKVAVEGAPLKILWSGVFLPRKALSLLLKALAQLPTDVSFELRVLGEGRMERRWKRLADRLGIDSHVEWMGWLPYKEALEQYEWADVFAFTSLRDTLGNVVVEAMANRLPVICLDHQGVHDLVTEQCGIKVPVTNPRRVVTGLGDAVARLVREPSMRAAMSDASIERARDFLWQRLGAQMLEIHRQVLAQCDSEPDTDAQSESFAFSMLPVAGSEDELSLPLSKKA